MGSIVKMKSKIKLFSLLFFLLLLCNNIKAIEPNDSISLYLMEKTWREFRAIHPFSFQCVGRKQYGDTCVLVMSEPAEWVKEDKLKDVFSKYGGQIIIKHQPFGIDGMLTDAVGKVNLDTSQYNLFEQELFNLLYYTDYLPFYTDLNQPVDHIYFSDISLNVTCPEVILKNYRIPVIFLSFNSQDNHPSMLSHNVFDLNTFSERSEFSDSWIPGEMSIEELCNYYRILGTNEIFSGFGDFGGKIIIWIVDENIDFNNDSAFLINARRFAIESDLILGTYKGKHKIAIIGRKRKVPFSYLPPLRTETILLLANNNEDLSLIFNSNRIKAINDSIYATPIEMSDALCNTELGNLMIMTDIYLKSWSENGKKYEYLINNPRPKNYPFPYGVAKELGKSTKYFWNYTNVYAGSPGFQPQIQTGSLPPMYWSANDTLFVEQNAINNVAFHYFASLNCPDLVRINMYAALHRIFRNFGVKAPDNDNVSWIQTPSHVISNAKLGYGGIKFKPRKPAKNVSKKIPPALNPPTRLPNIPTFSLSNTLKTPTNSHTNLPDINDIPIPIPQKINETLSLEEPILGIIKPQNEDGIEYVNESKKNVDIEPLTRHKSHILTKQEVHKKIISNQINESNRLEMYNQLRRFGISLKAIIDEKNHTVCIIINYDELKYDYAA